MNTVSTLGYAPADVPEDQRSHGAVSLLSVAALLLKRRRLLIAIPSVFVAVVGVSAVASTRTYTSAAGFIPQSSGATPSRIAGLAAQFGFAMPQSDNTNSPAFYANIVESRTVLEQLSQGTFNVVRNGRNESISLASLYDLGGGDTGAQRAEVVRRLSQAIQVTTTKETDIVRTSATTPWPEVSEELLRRLLKQLNDFNLGIRQSQAAAQRAFVEQRLDESRSDLRGAEGALSAFLQRNRQFANDPQLSFEHDRLEQEVSVRQQLFASLAQAYAQARFDALRNTPLIVVVEQPERPLHPDSRGLAYKLPLAALVGLAIATFIAFVSESWGEAVRRDPATAAQLRSALRIRARKND